METTSARKIKERSLTIEKSRLVEQCKRVHLSKLIVGMNVTTLRAIVSRRKELGMISVLVVMRQKKHFVSMDIMRHILTWVDMDIRADMRIKRKEAIDRRRTKDTLEHALSVLAAIEEGTSTVENPECVIVYYQSIVKDCMRV